MSALNTLAEGLLRLLLKVVPSPTVSRETVAPAAR